MTLLHQIFQRTGRLPSEVLRLPRHERAFVLASMQVTLEEEAKLAGRPSG
jgi:hypothetical protein